MNKIQELEARARALGCQTLLDEPMKEHTTFQIGGPADLFCTVHSEKTLSELLKEAQRLEIPVLMLGNGSNMLVSDDGVRGVVIAMEGDFIRTSLREGNVVECGPAVSLAGLCKFAQKHSLAGLEFAWGIPGTVGGAAYMNAGAYGGEMAQVITACRHLTASGEAGCLSGDELCYSYRRSAYMENGCAITSISFQLTPGNAQQIAITMEDYYNRRKSKQPLNKPSAGSVFKRPEGGFAGTLIEECGLRGQRIGGASVSEKHAGFIINLGGATCKDVLELVERIQETVLREKGVSLECEVKKIG